MEQVRGQAHLFLENESISISNKSQGHPWLPREPEAGELDGGKNGVHLGSLEELVMTCRHGVYRLVVHVSRTIAASKIT